MEQYSSWPTILEVIKEDAKPVLVFFDTPEHTRQTKKSFRFLKNLIGDHRTDLIQARVNAQELTPDETSKHDSMPSIQLYSNGHVVITLDPTDYEIGRKLVPYIGWLSPNNVADQTEVTPVDYDKLIKVIDKYTKDETDWTANCSNVSAAIWFAFQEANRAANWAGFYLNRVMDISDVRLLVLGPFHGKPATKRIQMHHGVCGAAATTRRIQLVSNVMDFPGHIACDSLSQSEIVIPMIQNSRLLGVLDMDCLNKSGFTAEDSKQLQVIVTMLLSRTRWNCYDIPVDNLPLHDPSEHGGCSG